MKILSKILTISMVILSAQSTNSFAQTSSFDQAFLDRGTEARATLTIPFGVRVRSNKDKTRLEFGIRQYQDQHNNDWILKSSAGQNLSLYDQRYIESKLGVTLSDNAVFLVNGQEWERVQEELGVGTAGKIGIGAVVIVAIAAGGVYLFAHELAKADD